MVAHVIMLRCMRTHHERHTAAQCCSTATAPSLITHTHSLRDQKTLTALCVTWKNSLPACRRTFLWTCRFALVFVLVVAVAVAIFQCQCKGNTHCQGHHCHCQCGVAADAAAALQCFSTCRCILCGVALRFFVVAFYLRCFALFVFALGAFISFLFILLCAYFLNFLFARCIVSECEWAFIINSFLFIFAKLSILLIPVET